MWLKHAWLSGRYDKGPDSLAQARTQPEGVAMVRADQQGEQTSLSIWSGFAMTPAVHVCQRTHGTRMRPDLEQVVNWLRDGHLELSA